jgi:hypothetical protein
MENILDQINGTLDAGFPYAALMLALAVPDICANLELPPEGKPDSQKSRYQRWFNKHLSKRIKHLSAEDCWHLRCGVVHQGQFGNKDQKFDRVFFTIGPSNVSVSDMSVGDISIGRTIGISIYEFIGAITDAVSEWFVSAQSDQIVQTNLPRMVTTYPDGFPTRIPGLTLATGQACIG